LRWYRNAEDRRHAEELAELSTEHLLLTGRPAMGRLQPLTSAAREVLLRSVKLSRNETTGVVVIGT
jgi:hypothetical protein